MSPAITPIGKVVAKSKDASVAYDAGAQAWEIASDSIYWRRQIEPGRGLCLCTHVQWLADDTEPSYRVRYYVAGASYPFPPEYLTHGSSNRTGSTLVKWSQGFCTRGCVVG